MPGNKTIIDTFLSCRSYLARAVSRIVPPHEIEDIVQETYVRVCQFKPKEEVRAPRALMVRITRNLALDHIKRAEWRLTGRIEEDSEMEIGQAGQMCGNGAVDYTQHFTHDGWLTGKQKMQRERHAEHPLTHGLMRPLASLAGQALASIEDPEVIRKILAHLDEKVTPTATGLLPESRTPPATGLFA